MLKVIDLCAGLGGRLNAFQRGGFEIVGAYEPDEENCKYLSRFIESNRVKHIGLSIYYSIVNILQNLILKQRL